MKYILIILSTISINAFAEGPILDCTATRTIARTDHPGHRVDKQLKITVSPMAEMATHQMGKSQIKTYLRPDGLFVIILADEEIEGSATIMSELGGEINHSLSKTDVSVHINCKIM